MNLIFSMYFFIQMLSSSSYALVHNVVDFGAKSGGLVDSTDAFIRAWNAACASKEQSSVLVPDGNFLIGVCTFSGPCQNENIQFQIQGTIIAPIDESKLMNSKEYIVFDSVNGLDIYGGEINARANSIWKCKSNKNNNCQVGARSVTIRKGNNIKIHELTSLNSNQYHIQIESSNDVNISNVNIEAPEDSPNTDGIHISRSTNITITDSNISTGDDCISIGPRTKGVYVKNCNCGHGHGISIGSLGKFATTGEIVQNINVEGVVFKGTQNGVRIKTWGKHTGGLVQGVTFHNITMQDVNNPIIIDQNYCPYGRCPKLVPSMIEIRDISYSNITGTSSSEIAIKFECSKSKPCSVKLADIKLTSSETLGGKTLKSSCDNVQGSNYGVVVPSSCI